MGPRSMPLRRQFMLVVILGAVTPLGLVGFWLAGSAPRSGADLLRGRLETSLAGMVEEVGEAWVAARSDLLEIADHPVVQRRLPQGATVLPSAEDRAALETAYGDYGHSFTRVVVGDSSGEIWWEHAPERRAEGLRMSSGTVPLHLSVYERLTGRSIGTIRGDLRAADLLPNDADWIGAGGFVVGMFDLRGAPLLPLTIEPSVFRREAFEWDGEPWVGVRQTLSEPQIELVLATPLGPIQAPFAEAARRGTLALILVMALSLLLVGGVSGQITASLRRLVAASDAVSAGDLDRTVPADGPDELVRLAHAFNAMTDSLRATLRRLAESESLAAVGEFAASLAHEVRNPLSSIRVDLQRAEERLQDPEAAKLVGRALDSVERLNATVTGALRVARSGRVESEPLDLGEVLAAARRMAEPEYRRRGVRLQGSISPAKAISVRGDRAALEQVFLNLLLNAAQAQGEGGEVGLTTDVEDGHTLVSVWDRGQGIPCDERERVFEPFYSTREGGTGLGLAVVERIVAAHEGIVSIEDHDGPGTTITVRLPLQL